jgi:hypothetical protein
MQEQPMQNEEETVQITTLASQRFSLTKDMLQIDEDMVQKQVKDVQQMELVLAKDTNKRPYISCR